MLRDKAGNKLWRKMKIKVIFPDNIFPPKIFIQHAGPRQGFGPDAVDEMLMKVADHLEVLYPFWEFKMQEMTPEHRTTMYLMTFAGYRAVPAPILNPPLGDEPNEA
jgi:hypothetical protein